MFNINLSKEETRQTVQLCLSKAGYADNIEAKVNIILDGSGSMHTFYQNGTVSALVDRALAVGFHFDDDGSIDVFDFADGQRHRQLEPATQDDHGSYKLDMLGGGTSYSPVVKRMVDFYYKDSKQVIKSGGFCGFFQKKEVIETAPEGRDGHGDNHPVFSIFITDGETWNEGLDQTVITKVLKEHPDLFIQFVGIGNSTFSFLKRLADSNNNCGFAHVQSLSSTSDSDLMTQILSPKAKAILTK